MKFKDKKTNKIIDFDIEDGVVKNFPTRYLDERWEEYEEPKEYWFISTTGVVHRFEGEDKIYTPGRKQIGNYFETKEEAELAVRMLKAWKRLKDNGFRFDGYNLGIIEFSFDKVENNVWNFEEKDLDLLFGGEE